MVGWDEIDRDCDFEFWGWVVLEVIDFGCREEDIQV